MADFIPVNGKLLAFGLTWVTISHPKNEFRERITLSRSVQAEYRVRYADKEIKYGLARQVNDYVGQQPKGTLLSAALLFSSYTTITSTSENSLLIYQIDEKKVAIIALLKGTPYLDVVVKFNELDSQLASLFQEGHADFNVYGNIPTYVRQSLSSSDLLSVSTSAHALVQFTDPIKRIRRMGIIVIVLGVIGSFGVWKMTKANHEAEEAAKNRIDPIQIYTENCQRLLASANFNGEAALNTIWQVIKKREINVAGWSLKNIKCTPTQCEELWQQKKNSFGNFALLRQRVHLPQTINLQANGENSVIHYPLTFPSVKVKTALVQSTLPQKEALWIELMSQQQRLKRINPALVFTPKSPKISGLNSNSNIPIMASYIPTNLRLYSGEITVSAPLGLATEIFQHHLRNVKIEEISINTFENIRNTSIQIKGTYYAQH